MSYFFQGIAISWIIFTAHRGSYWPHVCLHGSTMRLGVQGWSVPTYKPTKTVFYTFTCRSLQVWYFISKESAGPLNILIHSSAFLATILGQLAAHFWYFLLSVSLALSCLRCFCFLVSRTRNCARLLILATPVLEVKSHGNNDICDIIIVHMLSEDAQTNRCGKRKAILGTNQLCTKCLASW